jgi:transposase
MARRSSRHSRKAPGFMVVKPRGKFTERVQAVGPEHFGVLSIDCAKSRSKYLLCNFYGEVFIEPTPLPHRQDDFRFAIERVRRTMRERQLDDLVVAIERTGTYHRPVQEAFRRAHFDTRLVHPLTSKQFRQPADPGNKTDDTDLPAIHRAAVNGFGLVEPEWADDYQQLQVVARRRRDLVRKTSILRCQIRETLHQLMPGYAEVFADHFFDSGVAMPLARRTGSAQAVLDAGLDGLRALVPPDVHCRQTTLAKVLDWARTAPPAHPQAALLRAGLEQLDDDRLAKTPQIRGLEQACARVLVGTPDVLLLVLPGINVAGAAELAGEMGPILNYANANCITGRAALAPCRYQSDQVDRQGPLRRRGNRRLRHALMQIAGNLIRHNKYFRLKAEHWECQHKDPRWMRVKVAKIFSRFAFVVLTGKALFPHPACQQRHYILEKLLAFHTEHRTDMAIALEDLERAARQFPARTRREEIKTLRQMLDDASVRRRRGPIELGKIIPLVLARLGIAQVQSKPEGTGIN